MSFTVTTGKSVVLQDGQVQTEFIFTDGTISFTDHLSHDGSTAGIRACVERRIALEGRKSALPVLPRPGTVIDLTPVVSVPDVVDVARGQFFAEILGERQARRLATLTPDQQRRCQPDWVPDLPELV